MSLLQHCTREQVQKEELPLEYEFDQAVEPNLFPLTAYTTSTPEERCTTHLSL